MFSIDYMITNTHGALYFFNQVTPQSLPSLSLVDFVRSFFLWSPVLSLCPCFPYFFHPCFSFMSPGSTPGVGSVSQPLGVL